MLLFGLFVVSAIAFLYFVLPKLAGLRDTWHRIDQGDPVARGGCAVLEVLSFGGYIVLFRTVFVRGESKIDWRESYQITMAGLAATRLFAAAGAGGVALTAWALRRSGMEPRIVACRMIAFMALLYAVYMGALVIVGVGLRTGVFSGPSPFGFTVDPGDLRRRRDRHLPRRVACARGLRATGGTLVARASAPAPGAAAQATRHRAGLGRHRRAHRDRLVRAREPGLLGAVAWWGFDIAVLWACFHAFGHAPPFAVIVMAYFVGMLANTLPLPGGIGGVDGGMIGTFVGVRRLRRPRGRRGAGLPRVLVLAADDPGRDRLPSAAQDRQALARGARAGARRGLTAAVLYKVK